jgi:hypothetical protein
MKKLFDWMDTFKLTVTFAGFEINGFTVWVPIPISIDANLTAQAVLIFIALLHVAVAAAVVAARLVGGDA